MDLQTDRGQKLKEAASRMQLPDNTILVCTQWLHRFGHVPSPLCSDVEEDTEHLHENHDETESICFETFTLFEECLIASIQLCCPYFSRHCLVIKETFPLFESLCRNPKNLYNLKLEIFKVPEILNIQEWQNTFMQKTNSFQFKNIKFKIQN